MSNIAVVVKITAAPGKRDEVAAGLAKMFPTVEDEAGTILYILNEDLGNADVLWMYEYYTDQAALDAHSSSPAMAELLGSLGGDLMGAPPELIMVNPIRAKGVALD